MAAQEFLSQDEVDALLKGVNGDVADTSQPRPAGGVRACNLATQERIVRERMPALETINERFARALKGGLFDFMRRSPEISVGPVRVVKYGDFVGGLAVPTNLNVAQLKPLRGNALFVFEPMLVFLVVDNLFGGDGRFHSRVEARDFSATEGRIIRGMLDVAFAEYAKAWQPLYPLRFDYLRSETHPPFATIAAANDIVVVSSFTIELANAGGAFHICLPYAALEPIRELIYGGEQGDAVEPDTRWSAMLARQVQDADVELVAKLGGATIKVSDLIASRAGDVLPIDIAPTVRAEVDGVPLLECRYGVLNGHYALQVERTIAPDPRAGAGDADAC
jgi:flagellar motor switch protein FliM